MKWLVSVIVTVAMVITIFNTAGATVVKSVNHRRPASEVIKCSESGRDDEAPNSDFVVREIEAAKTCFEAKKLAESCAMGSSLDEQTAGAATASCEKQTSKLSPMDQGLRDSMYRRCTTMCRPETDGTLCASSLAFCRLSAAEWMNSLQHPTN